MERSNKRRSRRDREKARKAPKVPIKTYRWEDIRRARRRGGYPWTHLYKPPFTDKIDPHQFTMDALRRAKSSSPMGKRSDRIDISEVSSWADYSGKTTPTLLHELISEPEENVSKKSSRPSSVLIEEFVEDEEDDVQVKVFHTESIGSSDNISQYLDKDEQVPATSKIEEGRDKRAKSEEAALRKRKLSAESGHSRYSLSKLGVLKKLQEAKNKIKVPKLSFPTKKLARNRSSPSKGDKPNKEVKKTQETSKVKKLDQPVYIHIPLKPPPGETDEFSHFEFEAKPENGIITSSVEQVEAVSPDDVTEEKIEQNIVNGEAKEDIKDDKSPFSTLEKGPKVTTKPPLKINPAFKQFLKDVKQLKEKDVVDETKENKDPVPIQNETKPEDCKVENATANEDEQHTSDSESPKDDIFDKLFEANVSNEDEDSAPTNEPSRNVRSKSAEPPTKRRSSMDSSHSRKSLSKLGIMKKLQDASKKIKNALSMDNLKKKVLKQEEPSTKLKEGEKEKPKKPRPGSVIRPGQFNKPKDFKPVYIHIPLKPPEGQTDEFSNLENEPIADEEKKAMLTDSLDSSSPGSPKKDDIHFIFLTPPSDDEILDEKEPDIPETPSSSDDMVFFGSLKKLAQDVVDQVSPDSNKKTLEPVREESVSDKGSTGEIENVDFKETPTIVEEQPAAHTEPEEKIIVDVEDGLSETARAEEHLKSALKTTTEPASVKRVSFKRKSKVAKEKDDKGYEKIEAPKNEETKLGDIEKTEADAEENRSPVENKEDALVESVSVQLEDEEKSSLDHKIGTDLEEVNNKWSNVSGDHEYEPINPPDETTMRLSSVLPNVTVVDGETGDPKVVISATDILDKPIEEKKRPFFQFGSFRKEKPQDDGQGSSDTRSRSSQGRELPEIEDQPKPSEGPSKFQVALKQRTEQLKTKTNELRNKLHNIKKPNIHLPKAPHFKKPDLKKPDFKRFKIEKLHLPKIPDTASIHLPHISLPGAKKTTQTRTIETRQYSTESNADDSEQQTKRHKFDLSFGGTFPRFRKKQKPEQEVVFATVPRAKTKAEKTSATVSSDTSSIRIPLHSEDSADAAERLNLEEDTERETSEDIARLSGRRFSGDVALEVEYERENQAINRADYLSRWQHGNFKERNVDEDDEDERIIGHLVEQRFGRGGERNDEDRAETLEERLRRDEERPRYVEEDEEEFDIRLMHNKHMVTDLDNLDDDLIGQVKDGYSSEGSVSLQRKGRLGKLDIDSDEFFVVHEIREGFQTPANALAQMNEYDPIGSNRSLPMQMQQESRKPIKKPKRKKTPHVSQEQIPGDEESLEGVVTPSRPKRRSKRTKKKPEDDSVVPYQQTIPLEADLRHGQRLDFPRESLGILGDDERDEQEFDAYEKERMRGKNQPDILASDPYKQFQITEQRKELEEPRIPPRKHRSLKSLTQSENESILTDTRFEDDRNVLLEEQINPAQPAPPRRPSRRSRSHTSSLSRVSLPPSPRDTDSVFTDEGYLADNQQIPSYLIENQNYKQLYQGEAELRPCVEEPCVQDLRDYMGYSIVDKSKCREPPLPPPRTPPRRRKRSVDSEQKFATVPRHVGASNVQVPPVRPLRNYSTLSHMRDSRKSSSPYANDYENKENEVSLGQYIEIDDDSNRDLVSGEVVQKMRQRPLPAPPRPPRKPKSTRKSLQDITSRENIISSVDLKEETVSTQTEPLPPDFICEEIKQEPTDTVITPRVNESKQQEIISEPPERFDIYDPRTREPAQIRRELITPTVYSFEETVTHGTLLVQPIDGAKILPDHQLRERGRSVPITKEFSDKNETSEIPESFKKLRAPEDGGIRTAKAEKLQVSDLDVDRLTVNELLASKLIVSEVDSRAITTDEIQAKSGSLKVTNVELPPQFLEQLVRQLELSQPSNDQEASASQKKTSINVQTLDTVELSSVEPLTTRIDSIEPPHLHQERQQRESSTETQHFSLDPPVPPPRSCTLNDEGISPDAPPRTLRRKSKQDSPRLADEQPEPDPLRTEMLEPEVDDQPPPRPPQPSEGLYLPSQPPPSFYALRAKQYVDDNIPTAPRRKRHQSVRSRPVSRSRSTSDDSSSLPHRPSRLPRRSSEPSISELSGRLVQACGTRINNSLKRLIYHLTANLLRNADGKQDLHVFMVILLVLIAGLILLGYGEDRTVVHLHHWEYFNPPKDL